MEDKFKVKAKDLSNEIEIIFCMSCKSFCDVKKKIQRQPPSFCRKCIREVSQKIQSWNINVI